MIFLAPNLRKIAVGDGIIRNGLISRWPLDDGTGSSTARDDQSTNTGTLQGMDPQTAWVEGRLGGDVALMFSGASQQVLVTHVSALNPAQITVTGWFKHSQNQATWAAAVGKTNSAWNNGYGVFFNGGEVRFFYGNYTRPAIFLLSAFDREWRHFVGTFDGSNKEIYIDNVAGTPNAFAESPVTATDNLYLAYMNGGANYGGTLQDIRVYNRVLNATERAEIFAGTG